MAFALVGHSKQTGITGTVTTPAQSFTGGNLIVAAQTRYLSTTEPLVTPTDSQGNTYVQIGGEVNTASGSQPKLSLWYVENASVGAAQTVSVALGANSEYICLFVACFSGAATSSVLDQSNQTSASNQPGSVTPLSANQLIISGFVQDPTDTSVISIDSSFSITDQQASASSVDIGGALAYLIQTSAAAVNPTWSSIGGQTGGSKIATFVAGAGGADGLMAQACL